MNRNVIIGSIALISVLAIANHLHYMSAIAGKFINPSMAAPIVQQHLYITITIILVAFGVGAFLLSSGKQK